MSVLLNTEFSTNSLTGAVEAIHEAKLSPANSIIARDKAIAAAYATGSVSMAEIGRQMGITHQAVSLILKRLGVPGRKVWAKEKPIHSPVRTLASGGSVKVGQEHEEWVSTEIKARLGLETELMPIRHPFDILVNGEVRVDVKARRAPSMRGDGVRSLWMFNIGHLPHKDRCDYFICVFGDLGDVLVVPSTLASGLQSIGYTHPNDKTTSKPCKWDAYFNAWHLLETA